jgi:hypothetical protein
VCLVEVGKSRRGVAVVTAADDNSFAAWSAPSPATLGVDLHGFGVKSQEWGAPGGGGGVDARHAPYRSSSGKHRGEPFGTLAGARGDDRGFRGARFSPRRFADPLAAAEADAAGPMRVKNTNVAPRRRDAGWAPVRMHHRPTREPPRALAVDPGGGRLVSGFHDGSLTCATLPGWE